MRDERIAKYAELLLDTCLGVQPGWEVLVLGSSPGRPLLEEIGRALARRDAYAVFQLSPYGGIAGIDLSWLTEASAELVTKPSALQVHLLEKCDAIVAVDSPENSRNASMVDGERFAAARGAYRPAMHRMIAHEVPWVGCQFPTPGLAQDAGLSTDEFSDFLFGACLLDWKAEGERMRRFADRFDAAGWSASSGMEPTDAAQYRRAAVEVDAGGANMPGGEFFCSPVEGSAEGEIQFGEFPAVYTGREVNGVRLRFEGGRVVDASADTHEDFLLQTLDSDEGARRLGELGIGCNPGITRHMRNTLFDEKIDGTVHLALGHGFPDLGGTERVDHPLGHRQGPAKRRPDRARRRGRAGERSLDDSAPGKRARQAPEGASLRRRDRHDGRGPLRPGHTRVCGGIPRGAAPERAPAEQANSYLAAARFANTLSSAARRPTASAPVSTAASPRLDTSTRGG